MPADDPLKNRHCAFLVDNLAAAIDVFAASAGTPFGETRTISMHVESSAGGVTEAVSFVYSLDGTIELIQATGDGLFGRDRGLGFHHFGGIGTDPLETAIEEQEAFGAETQWRLSVDGVLFAIFLKPTPQRPVLVELLSPQVAMANA